MKNRKEDFKFDAIVYETLSGAETFLEEDSENLKVIGTWEYACALFQASNNFLGQYLTKLNITQEEKNRIINEVLDEIDAQLEEEEIEENDGEAEVYYIVTDTKNKREYLVDNLLFQAFTLANRFRKMMEESNITVNHVIYGLIQVDFEVISTFLKLFGCNERKVLNDFYVSINMVVFPYEIKDCLRDLTSEVDKKSECLVQGREKETRELVRVLLKATKRNAIITGKAGVGKTALVEKLAWNIATGNCCEEMKNFKIISLDVNALIAGTTYRGMAEERFNCLVQFLENNPNVILFIDEVHTILGAGSTMSENLDLGNSLKPILARGKTRVIGATTEKEYYRYFSTDMALKRRFERIDVKEPKFSEVPKMISKRVKALEAYHGVKISKEVLNYIMLLSSCIYFNEVNNPDRTIDAIDRAMAETKLAGKKEVSRKIATMAFDINLEKYNQLSIQDKKSTAYHEAGHFIVNRFSNKYGKTQTTLAVSILPAENYWGVNVYEESGEIVNMDREFIIEKIATCLGGRVAEKLFTKTDSAGASSDLKFATYLAKNIIEKYGLCENFGKNRVYNGELYNEKAIDRLNEEIDKIIEEAYALAEKIIKKHENTLKQIVNKLLRKGILSEEELKNICEEKVPEKTPEKV